MKFTLLTELINQFLTNKTKSFKLWVYYAFVRTRQYRNFMAKLYGWGASVVIIGALFKINHYPGADYHADHRSGYGIHHLLFLRI